MFTNFKRSWINHEPSQTPPVMVENSIFSPPKMTPHVLPVLRLSDDDTVPWYCWWKKSCTTWNVKNFVYTGINYLSLAQDIFHQQYNSHKQLDQCIPGIQSHCQWVDDWGVQSPPECKVFRFHYHSQKVIGSLGYGRVHLHEWLFDWFLW